LEGIVSIARGWLKGGEFVCVQCAVDNDRARAIKTDDRMASGRECVRCERKMPYEVKVRLLPDGVHSTHVPRSLASGEQIVVLERQEFTLADRYALVYVQIGTQRELGLQIGPSGKVKVWIHDDPYTDDDGPSAEWEYDPDKAAS